jgi:hypothetical protein
MDEQPEKQDETDRLFLTFSAEEIGRIVVAIIRGVERKAAIRAMPRYTKEQHKVYASSAWLLFWRKPIRLHQ